jgi:hypothetical protein
MHVHSVPYDIVLLHLLNYSSATASGEGIPPNPPLSSKAVADDRGFQQCRKPLSLFSSSGLLLVAFIGVCLSVCKSV